MKSVTEEKTANQAEAGTMPQSANGVLVIVEFAATTSSEAKDWLTALVRSPVSTGGAGLEARLVHNTLKGCDSLHLSATNKRLLIGAEKLKIKKLHKVIRGQVEFTVSHANHFEAFSEDGEAFLTMAEKQRIVMNALDNIKSNQETTVPGHQKVKLYSGRPIFSICISKGVITQVYPLHDQSKLKALEHKWYLRIGQKQPLDDIREYFGETIGMYFGFLGFYSLCLLPPVLLIVVFKLSGAQDQTKNTVFAILNLVWATAFLEFWKRRCSEISFKWGTIKRGIGTDEVEEPRPGYWGERRISPITGEPGYYYPPWKRKLKMYAVSYPLVLVCMWLATGVVLVYFQFLHYMESKYAKTSGVIASVMLSLPSVLYAIVIAVNNNLYHQLATFLTEWENHRLESAYNNHLIVKLVLFYFVNCFYSLFYIAFYLQDIELLRTHLGALMITSQLIGQVTESLIPYLMFRSRVTKVTKEGKKIVVKSADLSDSIERQSSQELYPGTFADYLELFLQFGYTFLFSSAYPMAAFWALLNNVIELRTDAFKMCRIYQRPFSQPAHSIGAWEIAFQTMGVIAVITNCALVGMAARSAHWLPDMTAFNALLLFVVIEHLLLGAKFFLSVAIPDVPQWVQDEMARQDFQSRLALKAQAGQQTDRPPGWKETCL